MDVTTRADGVTERGRTTGRSIGAGAALAVASAVGASVVFAGTTFMGVEVALCLLLGALILAPIALRWWTRSFDLFEPVVIISAVYFVYFVIGPLVHIGTDDLTFIERRLEHEYFAALLAVVVAVASMWLGYALPIGPRPAATPTMTPARILGERAVAAARVRYGRRLGAVLLVLAATGMVLWARLAGRSLLFFFLPGLSQPADSAEGGTDVSYLFFTVEWFVPAIAVLIATGGLRGRAVRAGLLGLLTIVYASLGFRYRVIVLWLAVGIITYLRAGRRPRLRYLLVPGTVAFLFTGWLAQARAFFRTNGAEGSLGFNLRDSVSGALSDTRIFDTFAAVLATVPRFIPHVGVTPFVYPLLQPIPRLFWADKPVPFWLRYVHLSVGTPGAMTGGPAVPHFGEFYLAFGWPGIALGMFLFGAAAGWLWRWFRAVPDDPFRQAVFALNAALLFQIIIRGYLTQIFQEWCFLVLPAIVIGAVARLLARERAVSVAQPAGAPYPEVPPRAEAAGA